MTDVPLRVVDAEYTVATDGYSHKTPIIHCFGRDPRWNRHHVPIVGYQPYFGVRQSEWVDKAEDLADDDRVLSVETTDWQGRPEQTIDGEPLVRVVVREPSDVADLRELFADPFEADVLFPTRFLVDMASSQWLSVPSTWLDKKLDEQNAVPVDEVHPPESEPETVPPIRVCTYDIEVAQGGDGPPVVSTEGTERAANPITAITAHDSYTSEYVVWLTAHPSWGAVDYDEIAEYESTNPCTVNIYENPHDTVAQFCEWVIQRDMDAMTGWNASGFDHPYLVNYGRQNGVSAVYDLSPLDEVYPMDGDGQFINSSLKGRLLLDSLSLYEKSRVSELDSYRLADVAEAEGVSVGKLAIEDEVGDTGGEPAIDFGWKHDPSLFTEYSLRDVQACVAINRESQRNVTII